MIFKLGAWETLWQSHLLAGVPIQSWPLQDEPETLPLLGDEDAALFSLLPQPSITVGHAQLAARHAASTHGRCHSCKDQIAEVTLYRDKQRFYWRQNKCATAWCFNQARTLMHGRQLQELFWGSVSCSWTLVVCRGLGLNYWKLFYNSLLNIFCWNCCTHPCTASTIAKTTWCNDKKTTSYQQCSCLVVFKITYKANLSKRSSLCLSSPENREKSSFVSVCGRSIISWG